MLKNIIKQIWNQRSMNGWILLELIIAGFFLWTVIDPVYQLTIFHLTPKGYESEGRYILHLGAYGLQDGKYDETVTMEQQKNAFLRVVRQLKNCPEVESVALLLNGSFPNGSWNGTQLYGDTIDIKKENYIHSQQYVYYAVEGSNIFTTYGMKDALTGGDVVVPEDAAARGLYFVSEGFARHMFGTIDVIGRKIYTGNKRSMEIAGVFKDFKNQEFAPIYPLVVNVQKDIYALPYMHYMYTIAFNLKKGVDSEAFVKRFMKEEAPYMESANYYIAGLESFNEVLTQYGELHGFYNIIRMKLSLAIFTLMCIFLGMVGTFWIRCNARRQEMGLMRSFGATKWNIVKRFLSESALIVTVAFMVSLIILVHYAMEGNMTSVEVSGELRFASIPWLLEDTPRFCMISLITYLILLLIALIGTIIPVKRAVNVLPADALRDE